MLRAASTAKAKSSAAASPPTSSSLRPATVAARSVARSSSTGACTLYPIEPAESAARACSLSPTRPSICQSLGRPAASGQTQALLR